MYFARVAKRLKNNVKSMVRSPLAPRAPGSLLPDRGVQPVVGEPGVVARSALLPPLACTRTALAERFRAREASSSLQGRVENERRADRFSARWC